MHPDALDHFMRFLREELNLPQEETRDIIALAEENLANAFAKIESTLAARDFEALADAAHSIKGALRNMGLPRLALEARELETQAQNKNMKGCKTLLAGLLQATGPLCADAKKKDVS